MGSVSSEGYWEQKLSVPFDEWTPCEFYGCTYEDVLDENGQPTGRRRCADCLNECTE